MRFSIPGALIAGLLSTLSMAALIYILPPFVNAYRVDVLLLLGTYFLPPGTGALAIGCLLFLFFGLAFAGIYTGLWGLGIGWPDLRIGLFFGFVHGLVSIAALQILYALNPNPPPVYMTGGKSFVILFAHLAYGLLLAAIYRTFTGNRTGRVSARGHA